MLVEGKHQHMREAVALKQYGTMVRIRIAELSGSQNGL